MLKPEHNLLMLAKVFQRLIASCKSGADFFIAAPAKAGQRLSTHIRKFAQGRGLRDRPVMQHVEPGKISARKFDLTEGTNDGISVGNVEHGKRLTQGWRPIQMPDIQNCQQCQKCQKSPKMKICRSS